MRTVIPHLVLVFCLAFLGHVPGLAQIVKCSLIPGDGYGGSDVTECTDAGDCGAMGASCCLRFTCVGHPPACGQNCGQVCTFGFTCASIDGSTACDADCGMSSIDKLRLRHQANNPAPNIRKVFFQAQESPASAPFTLVREVISFQHSATGDLHRMQTIAIRQDGSRSVTETIMGHMSELKRDIRFADGRRVTQFLGLGVKSTWPPFDEAVMAERRARLQALVASNCAMDGWAPIGPDTIQQQSVVGFSHTSDGLDWKLTVWKAPQLGCEDLGQLSYTKNANGTFSLTTETRTTRLTLGEPDSTLFQEPSTLREVSPDEVGQLLVQKYALPLTPSQIHEMMSPFQKGYTGSR